MTTNNLYAYETCLDMTKDIEAKTVAYNGIDKSRPSAEDKMVLIGKLDELIKISGQVKDLCDEDMGNELLDLFRGHKIRIINKK